MREERKQLFFLMVFWIVWLFAINIYLTCENQKLTERADNLAAQVYNLGSMLGEQNAAARAKTVISEVDSLD